MSRPAGPTPAPTKPSIMRFDQTERTFELLKVGGRQRLPMGVWREGWDFAVDVMTDNLVASLTAYVYARTGETATATVSVREAHFPRWFPKWLCRRLSRQRMLRLDATPRLVWPDATVAPPEFGDAVRIVSTNLIDGRR